MPGPITYSTFSSHPTLPAHARTQASQIAKAYRQAAQLFLTRRLPEAYFTIEPVITPRNLLSTKQHHQNQNRQSIGDNDSSDGLQTSDWPGGAQSYSSENEHEPAPIAYASRGTRVKVWSFYLTFLNAVVELGPEEGKLAFGSTRWKELVRKARDGSIWEDIVRDGYNGDEGAVDGEVVVNLATLLLTHSPSQILNQQRLETFLATSPLFFHPIDNFDNPDYDDDNDIKCYNQNKAVRSTPSLSSASEKVTNNKNNKAPTRHNLDLALKILELYALHILPRNDEWEYAREFLQMNDMLDEERRQAFLIALHVLREEERLAAVRGEERRQTNGRRRRARTGGKRVKDMGRRQSDTTVTATGSSISGDEAAAMATEKEHTMTVPTTVSREADFASSNVTTGLNTSAKITPEKVQQQKQNHQQRGDSMSKESQSSYIPTPVDISESKVTKDPTQQQQSRSPLAHPSALQPSNNSSSHIKRVNPSRFQEKNTKATNSNTENAKVNKKRNTDSNTNIFTDFLGSLLPVSLGRTNTTGSSILSSLFPIQNKHHPALFKSILYILAVLTGLGLIGSAAATGGGVAMAPAARRSRTPMAVRVRLENVLRMLRNLVVLVWLSVKRTVGMGVAISYV